MISASAKLLTDPALQAAAWMIVLCTVMLCLSCHECSWHCTGLRGTEHSPGVSLNTNFQLTGQSNLLLDESESSSADEEEVIELMLTRCCAMSSVHCIAHLA